MRNGKTGEKVMTKKNQGEIFSTVEGCYQHAATLLHKKVDK